MIFIIYIIIIISSISMIFSLNPVYGLKFLILIFLNFSILLIWFNISYLGYIFLMIYVGAVTILFLFVVMMLDIKKNIKYDASYLATGIVFLIILIVLVFFIINTNIPSTLPYLLQEVDNSIYELELTRYSFNTNNLKKVGIVLLHQYSVGLLLCGLILLVATLGSIYLTNISESRVIRRQNLQINRVNSFYILIKK